MLDCIICKDVSFAAVVDTNGKLIVGTCRKANTRLTTFMIDTSNNDDHDCPASYHFYSNYLVTEYDNVILEVVDA